MSRFAVVQRPPVFLDRDLTIERVVASIEEAAEDGAEAVVFPEAYVSGYPTWIWRLRPGGDMALTSRIHERLLASSVDISQGHLAPVQAAAARRGVVVGLGFHELSGRYSRATLFNSYAVIGADGALLNKHRKLMPTNPERMVWGMGDGTGLRVVDTPVGRVGVLICWELFMPLARQALYAEGVEVLLTPTWDSGEGWLGSMQHIAREGRCWVVGSATAMQASDLPDDFPERDAMYTDPDEWVNPGDAVVVAPGGKVMAGPHRRDRSILYAEVDASNVAAQRRSLDVGGHYQRPDVLKLIVDRTARPPVQFDD